MSKNSESSLLLSPFPSSYIPPQGSKMKSKASTFLKQAFSFLATMVKAKSMVAKSKRSAIKARLLIFSLLRNKKVLISAINHRIHALIGQEMAENVRNEDDSGKAIVVYDNAAKSPFPNTAHLEAEEEDDDDDDDYPDLRHSLFDLEDVDDVDEDDELVNGTGSVIDLVRNSREDGTEFILEDEIDHVADVFIRRFHRQMKIQKQESFKRYREMLARGV